MGEKDPVKKEDMTVALKEGFALMTVNITAAMKETMVAATTHATTTASSAALVVDIGYIKVAIEKIEKSFKETSDSFVRNTEFNGLSKIVLEHTAIIEVLKSEREENKLVRRLVFGGATMILVAVVGSIIYLVVKK